MLGDGAVWITPGKTGFALGAITVDEGHRILALV